MPPPRWGRVLLRGFAGSDVDMLLDLATDAYVASIGTLPHRADARQVRDYLDRQRDRLTSGSGYPFCVADVGTGAALGIAGLWLAGLDEGRASAGYSIAPRARGRGLAVDALRALTAFGWTVAGLHRVELFIEPDNLASVRTAQVAGYSVVGREPHLRKPGGAEVEMLRYRSLRPDGPVPGGGGSGGRAAGA